MSLITAEVEAELEAWLTSYLSAFSNMSIGVDVGDVNLGSNRVLGLGTRVTSAGQGASIGGSVPTLEQAYLAGKMAGEVGTNPVRRMSDKQVARAVGEGRVVLDETDRVRIRETNRAAQRHLKDRVDRVIRSTRITVSQANQEWQGELLSGRAGATAAARGGARASRLNLLGSVIRQDTQKMIVGNRRFLQTQIAQSFQDAQVVKAPPDEIVYKIPRMSAEFHCMRLHLQSDGMPIRYRLSEVIGNSNIGLPPGAWRFVIGPVHPNCYCILHRESIEKNPGANLARAEARDRELERVRVKGKLPGGRIEPSDFPGARTTSQAARRGRSRSGLGGGARVVGDQVTPASAAELAEARGIERQLRRISNQGSVQAELGAILERSASSGEPICCGGKSEKLPETLEKLLWAVRETYGTDSPLR